MASVKLKKGGSVEDLLKGDAKQLNHKGDGKKGQLTSKDGSLTIAYEVNGDTANFKMTKAPQMFKGDEETILKKLFG